MEDNITKINFFKKVWYSITKISKYDDMRKEGLGKSMASYNISYICNHFADFNFK